jgi:diacylglycerol kinase family enzyme
MNTANDILFFLNPRANEGNAKRIWERATHRYPLLPKNPIDITSVDIASVIAEKHPKIIAIAGGDGTINAVCREVSKMKRKPLLSILPLGFGNAISYCLGVETLAKAVDVLKGQGEEITIDLLRTNIHNHEKVVFNLSVGFDARIVFNRQNFRYIGFSSYIISAVRSFISHPEKEITLTIDHNVTLNAVASSLVIANCPIIGQNYVIAPKAKLNDGLLDGTLFSTKYAYLTNLRLRGFKHPLYSEMGKVRFKAKHIRIAGEPFVQIDGDPVVQKEGIEIEIMPSAITFLRNKKENINQEYLPFLS